MEQVTKPRPPFAHDIKINPDALDAVVGDCKRAEFRKMDRDYRVGDTLRLHSWGKPFDHPIGPEEWLSRHPPTQAITDAVAEQKEADARVADERVKKEKARWNRDRHYEVPKAAAGAILAAIDIAKAIREG